MGNILCFHSRRIPGIRQHSQPQKSQGSGTGATAQVQEEEERKGGEKHPKVSSPGPQDLASCSQNCRGWEDLKGSLMATCEGRDLVIRQAAQMFPNKTEIWAQLPPL